MYQHNVPSKRARKRKPHRLLLPVFLLIIATVYVGYTSLRPLAYDVKLSLMRPPNDSADITWPAKGQMALGIDGQGPVVTSPGSEKAPIASITKLVTALAVLEKKPFKLGEQGDVIRFNTKDVITYQDVISRDGAAISVSPGQTMTEYQAIQAMLLASANNIAITTSERVFGSEQAYADYANEMLKRLGFKQTHIAGASGLETGTYSTAIEVTKIAELTMKSPVLAQITSQDEAEIPGFPTIQNISHASKLVQDIHGIKVGLTDEAGACLAFWLDVQKSGGPKVRVYGSIIGQPDFRSLQAYANYLADIIPGNIRHDRIASAGDVVGTYVDKSGEVIDVIADKDIYVTHWVSQTVTLTASTKTTHPTLEIKVGNQTFVHKLALSKRPTLISRWRLLNPIN